MMDNPFSCPLCREKYDQTARLPKILSICGHSFCSLCSEDLIRGKSHVICPLDNKTSPILPDVQVFLPNITLTQLISKQSNENLCKLHEKKMKIVCLTDKCVICSFCERYGDHKGHNTKLLQDAKNEANKALKNLEASNEKTDKHFEEIFTSQKEKKEIFIKKLKGNYDKIREDLAKEEVRALSEANHYFEIALGLEALPKLRVLESLDLNLSSTSVMDQGLVTVFKSYLENIKFLGLQLRDTKISNVSVEEFKKALSGMKALKNLRLDFNRTKITKESQSFVDKVVSDLL